MTFPIKLMEEGYRVRNYCWTIIQTIYFVKAYDSYNTLHQKYTNTEKNAKYLKDRTCAMFFKSRGFKNIKYDIPACQKQITHIQIYILYKQGLQ